MTLEIENILPSLQKITGILHVGGHHGQEWNTYKKYDCPVTFIEPAKDAFAVLKEKLGDKATLFNCACGSREFQTEMFVEKSNSLGASNSLLKPKKHLEQYPEVQFTEKEIIQVRTLDSIITGFPNVLVIDTQGYELEVLKGATETLHFIDLIFTEVNRDELYEGCAMVEEIDEFLKPFGFTRTKSDWRGGAWGDAVYEKNSTNKIVMIPSVDKGIYKECWNPLYKLMKKYVPLNWPITLVTDGVDKGLFDKVAGGNGTDYGWVENLKRATENLSGIILMIQEDFFPTDHWNIPFIEHAANLMSKDPAIGCFRLYPCPGPEDETVIGKYDGISYGKFRSREMYCISCQVALWKAEFLHDILKRISGSAGSFEISGSQLEISKNIYSVIRSSPKWPVSYLCSGISRGKWNPDVFKLMEKENIELDDSN